MGDDIVDRIRIAETAPLDAGGKVALFLVLQDARAEIERLREERRWIPVGERLPDRNVDVLVWIPSSSEKTFIASLDEGGMWFSSDPVADAYSLGEDGAPAHWMPLPEPPNGGEVEE